MSRLTCNAILRVVYADFTSLERLSVRRNLLGILGHRRPLIFLVIRGACLSIDCCRIHLKREHASFTQDDVKTEPTSLDLKSLQKATGS